jgi:hypothetical protein
MFDRLEKSKDYLRSIVAENIEFRSHADPIGHLEGIGMARRCSGPFGQHGKARPALAHLRPLWQGSTRLVGRSLGRMLP